MSEKYDQEAFIYGRLEENPKTGEMKERSEHTVKMAQSKTMADHGLQWKL